MSRTNMAEHAPTPYTLVTHGNENCLTIDVAPAMFGMRAWDKQSVAVGKATGEFIVRACNSHEQLVAALQCVSDIIEQTHGHNDSGDRDDCCEPTESAADIVEMLCNVEIAVSDALDAAAE